MRGFPLLLSAFLVALPSDARAQAPPLTLGGHTLGRSRAQSIAPSVPCAQPLPDAPTYLLCKPTSDVSLWFQRDTLVAIFLVLVKASGPSWADSSATGLWQHVKDRVGSWFGAPDAVDHQRGGLLAVWNGKGARFATVSVQIERNPRGQPSRASVTAALRCAEGSGGTDIGACLRDRGSGRRRG